MMERFCKWLKDWEATEDDEVKLHSMLDSLDDIISQLIGDCASEGIDASEIQSLLLQHRRNSRRTLDIRMDVPEKLDWITKRIAAERLQDAIAETETTAEEQIDPFELHCRLASGTHEDKARAWLAKHPEDKRTLAQVKKASTRYPYMKPQKSD